MGQTEYTTQIMAVAAEAAFRAIAAQAVADDLLAEAVLWGADNGMSIREVAAQAAASKSTAARAGRAGAKGSNGHPKAHPEYYEQAFKAAVNAVSSEGWDSAFLTATLGLRVGVQIRDSDIPE